MKHFRLKSFCSEHVEHVDSNICRFSSNVTEDEVPEVANGIEVRSSSAGRGLFVTANLKGGDVVLCGLPLARCVNSNFGEPLVPALQKASESDA